MFRSGRKKLLSILLVVAVMGSSLVAMSPGTASGVITATATAVPGMFSVWGFGLLPQPQFDPGPSYTTLIVTGVDSSATVTVDVTSMIDAIFPNLPARISMFPQSTRDAYEAHRTSLANSPFVWDDALNAWTHQLGKELTPSSPSPAVRAVAESML
ncbi:MAG: hypothetical protein HYX90_04880, partial [Chloroflexi bacterium]|nr:hypothetical protein [Chloroflexota bacterium]